MTDTRTSAMTGNFLSLGPMLAWNFTIYGAPRTKKTHNQVVIRGGVRVLPSKQWREWAAKAVINRGALPMRRAGDALFWCGKKWTPLDMDVNCRATFYRDANRGDAVGYYQGLADLLEKRGVITNDRLIVSWDGSRLLRDTNNPRVELTLERV